MKSAAITGILGQDGTYLARWLVHQGYEVHGLIRLPLDREQARVQRRFTSEEQKQLRFHTGSLEDPFSLLRLLKEAKPAEVYHLAGVSDSRQSFIVPEQTVNSITTGTLRLLEAARAHGCDLRIFLASSCEIFGVPPHSPQDENTPRNPVTPYGIAKVAADSFARLHREQHGQFISTGILYNHESPLRPANYLSRRVSQAVAAIKRGQTSKLELADLSAERDWSDARDFVRGYWQALQADRPGDYVFASGAKRKVEDFVACAFRAAGLDHRNHVNVTPRTGDAPQVTAGLCGNPRRAEKELGWKREWEFADMVADLVAAEMEERPELARANPLPERRRAAVKK